MNTIFGKAIVSVYLVLSVLAGCTSNKSFSAGSVQAANQLQKDLKGEYEELFSEKTLLNSKWNSLWVEECKKYVGEQSAESAAASLKLSMSGTLTGPEATERFGDGTDGWANGFQFDCDFKNGVNKFVFDGKSGIKGLDGSGQEVFSHKYVFDSYNSDLDFYLYKSEDDNQDAFAYFAMRSDSPAATHHIEFRYGSDVQSLNELCTGRYAYWMAAGVLCGSESEQKESISLFVRENLGQ